MKNTNGATKCVSRSRNRPNRAPHEKAFGEVATMGAKLARRPFTGLVAGHTFSKPWAGAQAHTGPQWLPSHLVTLRQSFHDQ